MKRIFLSIVLVGALSIAGGAAYASMARSDQPPPPGSPPPYRAGFVSFLAGQAGTTINFGFPEMKDANYSVVVQPANTAGYSTTSACTYFNVLHQTAAGFQVQHKRCDDGTPVVLDTGITLEWIAVERT